MVRTFVAIEVSEAVKELALGTIRELTPMAGDYRWAEPKNLHVTTNFLGEIPDQGLSGVTRCLVEALADIDRFVMEIGGIGAFPDLNHPSVLWAGIAQGREDLMALQSELQAALSARLSDDLGLPDDRYEYNPHLTLGRANGESAWTKELLDRLSVRESESNERAMMEVDRVTLYTSRLEPTGPIYTPVESLSLC